MPTASDARRFTGAHTQLFPMRVSKGDSSAGVGRLPAVDAGGRKRGDGASRSGGPRTHVFGCRSPAHGRCYRTCRRVEPPRGRRRQRFVTGWRWGACRPAGLLRPGGAIAMVRPGSLPRGCRGRAQAFRPHGITCARLRGGRPAGIAGGPPALSLSRRSARRSPRRTDVQRRDAGEAPPAHRCGRRCRAPPRRSPRRPAAGVRHEDRTVVRDIR